MDNLIKHLQDCIDTAWISSEGPFEMRFEEHFGERLAMSGFYVPSGLALSEAQIETVSNSLKKTLAV